MTKFEQVKALLESGAVRVLLQNRFSRFWRYAVLDNVGEYLNVTTERNGVKSCFFDNGSLYYVDEFNEEFSDCIIEPEYIAPKLFPVGTKMKLSKAGKSDPEYADCFKDCEHKVVYLRKDGSGYGFRKKESSFHNFFPFWAVQPVFDEPKK